MGLNRILQSIFKGEDIGRINEMVQILEDNKIFDEDDLKYMDRELVEKANFFTSVEIKKLLAYNSNPKPLRHALEKIFGKTNRKLGEIEEYLNENEVYLEEDLALYDLNKIEQEKTIFSDRDILKIKNHIRREHPDNFSEILEREKHVKYKKALELEAAKKSEESNERLRDTNLNFLFEQRERLSEALNVLHKRLYEVIIGQTRIKNMSGKSSAGNISSVALMSKGNALKSKTMGRTVALMTAAEIIQSCKDVYKCILENSTSAKDAQSLRDQLQKLQRDIENNEKKIKDELDNQKVTTCTKLSNIK